MDHQPPHHPRRIPRPPSSPVITHSICKQISPRTKPRRRDSSARCYFCWRRHFVPIDLSVHRMVPEHDAAVSTGRDECRRMGGVKAYVVDAVDIVDAVGRCTVAAEFEVVSAVLATRQLGIALKETKEKDKPQGISHYSRFLRLLHRIHSNPSLHTPRSPNPSTRRHTDRPHLILERTLHRTRNHHRLSQIHQMNIPGRRSDDERSSTTHPNPRPRRSIHSVHAIRAR